MSLDRDRFRGALLGVAAGDAVGTTLEFKAPGTFQPIDDMVGGGPFRLAPGGDAAALGAALDALTGRIAPALCDGLQADRLGRFLALRPVGGVAAIAGVAAGLHAMLTPAGPVTVPDELALAVTPLRAFGGDPHGHELVVGYGHVAADRIVRDVRSLARAADGGVRPGA